MADRQPLVPVETETMDQNSEPVVEQPPSVSTETETTEQNSQFTGEHPPMHETTMAYWCHQCNKEVMASGTGEAQTESGSSDALCPDCHGGFVELMATARALPDVRRAQRRGGSRGSRGAAASSRHTEMAIEDEYDEDYPHQVMQLLRFLARTTRLNSSSSEQGGGRGRRALSVPTQEGQPPTSSASSIPEDEPEELLDRGSLDVEPSNHSEANDPLEDEPITASLGAMAVPEEESDSEAEAELLEFGDWDSIDENEEEWEEIEGGEEEEEEREEEREEREEAGEGGERAEGWEDLERAGGGEENNIVMGSRERSNGRLEVRPRNFRRLHHRLREILRNLEAHDIEVRLETPDGDTFVGNPGDYLDARGFEQLLQQLWENDSTRRGAPPASKTAVENLPTVTIVKKNVDDGSALCAICKDSLALNDLAKQMPCHHLYHGECILHWLSTRNSCPICRFELPTDDPDYEQQKQSNIHRQQGIPVNTLDGSVLHQESHEGREEAEEGGQPHNNSAQ